MQPIFYNNLNTGDSLRGIPGDSLTQPIRLHAGHNLDPLPSLTEGDVLALSAEPDQQLLILDIDRSCASLRGRMKHYRASATSVTGRITVQRRSSASNEWGRLTDTLETVLEDAPAALGDIRLTEADEQQAGGSQLLVRQLITVQSDVGVQAGDSVICTVSGAILALTVRKAWPLAGRLWQLQCTAS